MHKGNISKDSSGVNLSTLRKRLDEAEDLLNSIIESQREEIDEEQRQEVLSLEKLALWQENQNLQRQVDEMTSEIYFLNKKFKTTLNSIHDGIIALDTDGKIIFINNTGLRLLGYDEVDLLQKPLRDILLQKEDLLASLAPSEEADYLVEQAQEKLGFAAKRYAAFLTNNDEKLPIEYNTVLIEDSHEVSALISFQDIRKRIESETKLAKSQSFDALTQIPNRHMFEEIVKHGFSLASRDNNQIAVLYFDLNNLQAINQAYGFMAGNCLLKDVASRVKLHLRKSDLVARISGDEFAIYIGKIKSSEDAKIVAEKVHQLFDDPFDVANEKIHIHVSMGIACYPRHATCSEDLLKHAEAAMYKAKHEKDHQITFYSSELSQSQIEHLKLESDLMGAIERGEFIIHYLPQYELTSKKIIAIEALIRWNHPELGLIFPDKFLDLVDTQGYNHSLTLWTIRTVLEQFKQWCQFSKELKMSINLGANDFANPDLTSDLLAIIQELHVKPEQLQFEIAETTIMQDIAHSQRMLKDLKKLGVSVFVDNFGIAHSSLLYLNRLAIDGLKIDIAFVRDLQVNEVDKKTIEAIIQLGTTFQLSVSASGIENKTQLEFLTKQNCRYGQGYYFTPPIEADKIMALIKQG